jgi:hypothetical protein
MLHGSVVCPLQEDRRVDLDHAEEFCEDLLRVDRRVVSILVDGEEPRQAAEREPVPKTTYCGARPVINPLSF